MDESWDSGHLSKPRQPVQGVDLTVVNVVTISGTKTAPTEFPESPLRGGACLGQAQPCPQGFRGNGLVWEFQEWEASRPADWDEHGWRLFKQDKGKCPETLVRTCLWVKSQLLSSRSDGNRTQNSEVRRLPKQPGAVAIRKRYATASQSLPLTWPRLWTCPHPWAWHQCRAHWAEPPCRNSFIFHFLQKFLSSTRYVQLWWGKLYFCPLRRWLRQTCSTPCEKCYELENKDRSQCGGIKDSIWVKPFSIVWRKEERKYEDSCLVLLFWSFYDEKSPFCEYSFPCGGPAHVL